MKEVLTLNCVHKDLIHIMSDWPQQFGTNQTGKHMFIYFSGNPIKSLQQLPETDGVIRFFSCRHCQLTKITSSAFIDTTSILQLDLSWNDLTGEALTPDIFRGRYNDKSYEPIMLERMDLSHNQIHYLDRKLFEHTPNLHTLAISHNPINVLSEITTMAFSYTPQMKVSYPRV